MKRSDLIAGICATLSVARIAQEKDVKQSDIITGIKNKNKELVDIHSKYINEFIEIFNQL